MDWDKIQDEWKQDALATDKEDLLGLLTLRFGKVPEPVETQIRALEDGDALERLILVAANISHWDAFVAELKENGSAFRIVGSQYQPF